MQIFAFAFISFVHFFSRCTLHSRWAVFSSILRTNFLVRISFMSELNTDEGSIRNYYGVHIFRTLTANMRIRCLFAQYMPIVSSRRFSCILFETLYLLPIILFHRDILVRFLAHQTFATPRFAQGNKPARSKERDKMSGLRDKDRR